MCVYIYIYIYIYLVSFDSVTYRCNCDMSLHYFRLSKWFSDSLRTGRSGNLIPVEARFSTLVKTGPRAHPASCEMDTGSVSWR